MSARPPHVLITGGSRGIGLSIAQIFASKSYRCTLLSRSESNLKAAVSTLQPLPSPSSPPHQHAYIPGDVTKSTQFWSPSVFGNHLPKPSPHEPSSRIDVLVNCAGITQAKLFSTMDDASVEKIINTNLTSMMLGTRFLLRNGYLRAPKTSKAEEEMEGEKGKKAFSPVIINVSSLLGIKGGYGAVAYAASKAGVLGFTRALATEYASHKVRVNAVVPGYVETEMTKDLNTSEIQQRIPLGRFGKTEEIAHAALFLAENEYAHNCIVNLDGGLSAV